MPLSQDSEKRARQLANLRNWTPGDGGLQRRKTHGGYALVSGEELDAKTQELCERLGRSVPVQDDSDWLAVRLLAENRIRRDRCTQDEARRGFEDPKTGRLRASVDLGFRLDGQALELCKELGLTPRARVAIGVQLAAAAESYTMRMARQAQEAREAHARQNGDVDA